MSSSHICTGTSSAAESRGAGHRMRHDAWQRAAKRACHTPQLTRSNGRVVAPQHCPSVAEAQRRFGPRATVGEQLWHCGGRRCSTECCRARHHSLAHGRRSAPPLTGRCADSDRHAQWTCAITDARWCSDRLDAPDSLMRSPAFLARSLAACTRTHARTRTRTRTHTCARVHARTLINTQPCAGGGARQIDPLDCPDRPDDLPLRSARVGLVGSA
jgi:hypothetical protein